MSDEQQKQIPLEQLRMDPEGLFREETYTDLRLGSIRRLIPVKPDGTVDETRTEKFTGEAQIMTHGGPIPVTAVIEANTLEEAVAAFPEAVQEAVEQLMEEVRELQRREASRIVVPGRGTPGAGTPPGPGGGNFPGGGKIELP